MRTLIIMVTLLVAPTWVAPTVPNPPIVNNVEEKKEEIVKNMDLFLLDLGFQESGNRYDVVNRFGYMGKYQFGKSTLRTLKIKFILLYVAALLANPMVSILLSSACASITPPVTRIPERAVINPTASTFLTSSYVNVPPIETLPINVASPVKVDTPATLKLSKFV